MADEFDKYKSVAASASAPPTNDEFAQYKTGPSSAPVPGTEKLGGSAPPAPHSQSVAGGASTGIPPALQGPPVQHQGILDSAISAAKAWPGAFAHSLTSTPLTDAGDEIRRLPPSTPPRFRVGPDGNTTIPRNERRLSGSPLDEALVDGSIGEPQSPSEMIGSEIGNAIPTVATVALTDGLMRAPYGRIWEGAKAAAPEVGKGIALAGAGAVSSELPIPYEAKILAGVPTYGMGVRMIGKGLKSGLDAFRGNGGQVLPFESPSGYGKPYDPNVNGPSFVNPPYEPPAGSAPMSRLPMDSETPPVRVTPAPSQKSAPYSPDGYQSYDPNVRQPITIPQASATVVPAERLYMQNRPPTGPRLIPQGGSVITPSPAEASLGPVEVAPAPPSANPPVPAVAQQYQPSRSSAQFVKTPDGRLIRVGPGSIYPRGLPQGRPQ
jgi:hypothetical protein